MKKYFVILLSAFSVLFSCISAFAAETTVRTPEEADDHVNLYYPQTIYNGGVNMSQSQNTQEAYVDPATGSVNVKVTDVKLPGAGGFDLNITRMYSSSNANLFEGYLKETDNLTTVERYAVVGVKKVYTHYTDNTIEHTPYYQVGLTPQFFTDIHTKTDEWMLKNSSKYEYAYSEELTNACLFADQNEAVAAAAYLNATYNEIDTTFPYSNMAIRQVDYDDFVVKIVPADTYDTEYSDALLDDTANERYSKLGIGWEFTFPYIEMRYGYSRTYRYLHFGEKGTWRIDFADGGDNNLDGYELNDIKIVSDSSITHDGKRSRYRVDEKNGTKHYFGEDGRLLIQEDRFGNQIKFYCEIERYKTVDGYLENYPYIKKIVDTLGREIIFTFETDKYEDKYVYMTITDPNDAENSRVYQYWLSKLSDDEIGILNWADCKGLEGEKWVLYSVEDPTGYACSYRYDYLSTRFSFKYKNESYYNSHYSDTDYSIGNSYVDESDMWTFDGVPNRYALLKRAWGYNSTEHEFKYSSFIKNCSLSGAMIFYKAYQSQEKLVDSYEDDSYDINKKTYNYDIYEDGEYDGYVHFDFEDYIPSNYTYAVKVTDQNLSNGKTSYDIYQYQYIGTRFDKTMLLGTHTDQGTDHKLVTNYTYDTDTRQLTNVSTTNYSVKDSTKYMTTSTAYTYDTGNYGDVLTEKPNGDTDRMVTYTYHGTYHYPLSKTYKRNESTTIKEEYIPTADGKSVAQINICENNVLKSKIEYSHDGYGNITNQKQYTDSEDYIETQYTYQNGAYVASETVKKVADNDNETGDITTTATYDYWGNQITVTDSEGNTTSYVYSLSGDVLEITNPDRSQKFYEYDTTFNNQEIIEEDELGNRVRTVYLYARKPQYIRYNSFRADYKYFYYDAFGNLETEELYCDDLDEEGWNLPYSTTHYTYDTAQRPISKEVYDSNNVLIYKETYAYDVTADYTKETVTVWGGDGNPDVVTSVYYDKYGNKTKTEVGDSVETYTSDYAGNITSVKSANANANGWSETRTTEYDYMGNVIKETDELGNITRAEYDSLGRMTKAYDQNNYASEYKYDALGRVIEQKVPVEEKNGTVYYSVKKMWYDGNGNVVKERILTNSAGESDTYSEVIYTYDNRNNLVMTETSDGETANYTQYYYDAKGNVLRTYTGLTSPLTINGLDDVTAGEDTDYAVTKYTYDKFGRVTQVQDALGNSETNTYDAVLGLLMSTTDRNGQTFNFTYDGMGNLTSKALADGTNAETATYGLTGQVLSKENGNSTISYTYNNKGQLVSESDSATSTVKTYTYDANGNRTGFTLKRNGNTEINQTYAYDKLNRLVSVSENGTVIATYSYDNKGNRTSTVSNGITTEYAYNLANMLVSQTSGNKLTESYTYYLNGNQKSKTSNGETTNYVYDKMNRLVSENDTVYTFDDFGNRKTMTDGEATTTYTYDLNNRLLESNEVAGDAEVNTKYFYDANGNQTTKAVMSSEAYDGAGAGHTVSGDTNEYIAIYDYNCYNQLVGVDTNGVISSYAYLPDGMRLSKTVGTDTTTFVYDGANIVEEITANGVNKYYRGIEIIKNDDNVYYLYNGQGDVAILTDSAGNIVANYIFDAYGNTDSENSVYNNFGYRGEYSDAESGLIYLRARMYDPSVGRFINEDPIRDGLNWYVYCGGNPVMFVDPTGCILQEEIDLYNKGQLSQDVYDILVDLGNRWENAKTDAARDEIHNLAEQFRNNNYKYQDLSNEANAQLWENGQKMYLMRNAGFDMLTDTIALAGTGLKWYSLVDNDKLWDYKERPALWMPKEEYFMMYGKLISFADFGNINYGYTGTVLGLSPETLYKGAGYVQSGVVNNYASQYYGDSEVDFGNVKRGIEWANSSGYVGIISLPLKLIFGVKEAITP